MALSAAVIFVLGMYAIAMALTFYFCVIADPIKSNTARFISHTLPSKAIKFASNIVGNKGIGIIEKIMEKLLAIIYLAVVVGGYAVLVFYGYPKARASTHVPDYHLTMGHILFGLAIVTWVITMTASPGIITKETIQFYDHFPYDDLLYVEGRYDKHKGIPRIPRSKFDRLKYKEHVPRFDHYCGWVASTIGEENYRLFLFFVFTQFVMCVYASIIILQFFGGEIEDHQLWEVTFFDRITGLEFKATKLIVVQFLVNRHLREMGILVLVLVMSALLTYFLGYHFYITSKGMTTNEHFKWGEVRKWHQGQVRKYEQYKRHRGISDDRHTESESNNQSTTNTAKPSMDDSLTTDGASKDSNDPGQIEEIFTDPGPLPKNIYNRGFVQNWMEVLFPISLRKRREMAMGGDKPKAT